MEAEITPLTVDPELKWKWNRLLQLEQQAKTAERKLGEKLDELNKLRGELGIH